MLARHVSDLIGPSSGEFYKLYVQIWYVVIRVLLDAERKCWAGIEHRVTNISHIMCSKFGLFYIYSKYSVESIEQVGENQPLSLT